MVRSPHGSDSRVRVSGFLACTSIPLRCVTNMLNDWNIHLVRTRKSMLRKCPGRLCFYNGSMQRTLPGLVIGRPLSAAADRYKPHPRSSPVVFAVLQERMSVAAWSVCAHVRVPACHGTSRDVVLHTQRQSQWRKDHINVRSRFRSKSYFILSESPLFTFLHKV